jgi:hypothetical protein
MTKAQAKPEASKPSATKASQAASTDALPFSPFAPNFQGLNGLGMGAASMGHWVAANQEVTRFYSNRLKKDLAAMSRFAECKTPSEFAGLWVSTARDAAHDYVDELDRLVAINFNGADKAS